MFASLLAFTSLAAHASAPPTLAPGAELPYSPCSVAGMLWDGDLGRCVDAPGGAAVLTANTLAGRHNAALTAEYASGADGTFDEKGVAAFLTNAAAGVCDGDKACIADLTPDLEASAAWFPAGSDAVADAVAYVDYAEKLGAVSPELAATFTDLLLAPTSGDAATDVAKLDAALSGPWKGADADTVAVALATTHASFDYWQGGGAQRPAGNEKVDGIVTAIVTAASIVNRDPFLGWLAPGIGALASWAANGKILEPGDSGFVGPDALGGAVMIDELIVIEGTYVSVTGTVDASGATLTFQDADGNDLGEVTLPSDDGYTASRPIAVTRPHGIRRVDGVAALGEDCPVIIPQLTAMEPLSEDCPVAVPQLAAMEPLSEDCPVAIPQLARFWTAAAPDDAPEGTTVVPVWTSAGWLALELMPG